MAMEQECDPWLNLFEMISFLFKMSLSLQEPLMQPTLVLVAR